MSSSFECEKKTQDAPSDGDAALLIRGLPSSFLPNSVLWFYRRNAEPFRDDSEYFDALVACEKARRACEKLKEEAIKGIYSSKNKYFAKPLSEFFVAGRELEECMRDLSNHLDEKRQGIVNAMEDPPLIEKFLANMKAEDYEKQVFRLVLVDAANMLGTHASATCALNPLEVLYILSDKLSLSQVMALVSTNSKWVSEQIYQRLNKAEGQMTSMQDSAIRVLMGLDITSSQFHDLESQTLQATLLEDESFQETATGKLILSQEQGPGELLRYTSDERKEEDELDFLDDQATLARALESLPDEKSKNVYAALATMKDPVSEADAEEKEVPATPTSEEVGPTDFGPYRSEMTYLEDQIRLMDKVNAFKKAKSEATDDGDDEDSPLKFDLDKYNGKYNGDREMSREDKILEKSKLAGKLETKVNKLQEKIRVRLRATKKLLNKTPRLEQLCEALDLDQFERFVILDLMRMKIMPFHYNYMNQDGLPDGCVAAYIDRFTHSLEGRMKCRSYFYKSSKLVSEGIVTLSPQSISTDFNSSQLYLDRRMFDFLVGLDTEFSELVEGSHLYTPDVALDDVVLPREMKDRICDAALNFENVKDEYRSLEIDKKITYGLGKVLLFYGASGTGKTMMANALAAKLKRKVLLVNFPNLGENTGGEVIKLLFREARIQEAVLFFDECETLFGSRDRGNYQINTILSELERFDDMCILATNRHADLDEAMFRRVSLAVEFKRPDHILRERIWKTLQPPKLELADDVDFQELAQKYELPGGFIKNAWLTSVSFKVQRGDSRVTQADLEKAASEQVVGRLSSEDCERQIVATCGISSVVASSSVQESLRAIVQNTKAQQVLFGQWGFSKIHRAPKGVSALFYGQPGTGKTMAAEAVAFDLGRPIMAVNMAELVDKYVGETGKNIDTIFKTAKQKDAVLVFDEAEGLFGTRVQAQDAVSRHDTINVGLLLQSIENSRCTCIVITNQKAAIDNAFLRRFQYVVDFKPPTLKEREKLWEAIIPSECPLADDVSLTRLAHCFELSGGDIKSAAIRAATRAALRPKVHERVVNMKDLEESCREEQAKKSDASDGVEELYS